MIALLTASVSSSSICNAEERTPEKEDIKLVAPRQRSFTFEYGFEISGTGDKKARVWLPIAQNGMHQEVKDIQYEVPAKMQFGADERFGNKIAYFETEPSKNGSVRGKITYRVLRREAKGLQQAWKTGVSVTSALEKFLLANRNVPVKDLPLPERDQLKLRSGSNIDRARVIYNHVDSLVKYDKSKPGYGRGDVIWVCDSRTGNCTDFHSLFISLARQSQIPARFEIGFPLPPESGEGQIGGYHCWASFFGEGNRWISVDISEADKHPEMKHYYFGNLTENRIRFSVGRDIRLTPPQQGEPLNYFIYPYVEVDGQVLDRKNIKLDFRYRDATEKPAGDKG